MIPPPEATIWLLRLKFHRNQSSIFEKAHCVRLRLPSSLLETGKKAHINTYTVPSCINGRSHRDDTAHGTTTEALRLVTRKIHIPSSDADPLQHRCVLPGYGLHIFYSTSRYLRASRFSMGGALLIFSSELFFVTKCLLSTALEKETESAVLP